MVIIYLKSGGFFNTRRKLFGYLLRRIHVARRCVYCGKAPVTGNKISHSNIKTKIRHFPNLQKVRGFVDGITQRVYACTRCLRSGFLEKPRVSRYKPEAQPAT